MPARSIITSATRRAVRTLAGLVLIAVAISCDPRTGEQAAPHAERPGPSASPAARPTGRSFDHLVGRWVRTDGSYVLEIRAVSPEGRIQASYLNPRSINVARAEATRGGDLVTLLVELRDVNYPGSTYKLWYDDGRDTLEGTYYQAAQQQTYDVVFARQSR